jgi:hypothetical protein
MKLPVSIFVLQIALLQSTQASEPRQLKWADLSTLVGHTVEITFEDRSTVAGKLVGVEPAALVVTATRSSNLQAHPKGQQSIARDDLKRFRVRGERKRGRIIGTISGVVGGIAAGAVAAIFLTDPLAFGSSFLPTAAVFFGVTGGVIAAGYFLGRSSDRRWATVVVLP